MKLKIQDYIGRKFGRLTIIEESTPVYYEYKYKHIRRQVRCLCDCGISKIIDLESIRAGRSTSCGCYNKEQARNRHTTHGLVMRKDGTRHPDYVIWTKLKSRCLNPKDKSYKHYGGRGIKICDRWLHSFENFIADLGYRHSQNYSLERIDVNGDYCPENCKWILKSLQSRNSRRVKLIEYKGDRKCLSELCRELSLSYNSIRHKVYDLKIPFEEAIKIPKHKKSTDFHTESQTILTF